MCSLNRNFAYRLKKRKDMEEKKAKFIELLRSTGREGIDNIIEVLEGLGFFTAPASTKFHLSYDGGLLEHSLNVCEMALELQEVVIRKNPALEERLPKESVIIASLLHDVCKSDIYKPTVKKMKNKAGEWVDTKTYDVDHGLYPFGHGEKSVILLLQNGLKLTNDEMLAIRWHMGAWDLNMDSYEAKGNFNKAKDICPMVQLLIAADGLASQVLEGK